jgi:Amt family ammonium transporter
VVTNTAAAAAALAWAAVERLHRGKPTVLGAATGAVAGLVAITPAAGFVSPLSALVIGAVGGAICYLSVASLKSKLGYDDALDAFGCHGVGGTWGAIATGLFASKAVNSAGAEGLFYGNPDLLKAQLIAVAATIVFAAVGSFILLKVVSIFTPLRATEGEEQAGLDLTQHGEEAYHDAIVGGSLRKQPVGQGL